MYVWDEGIIPIPGCTFVFSNKGDKLEQAGKLGSIYR